MRRSKLAPQPSLLNVVATFYVACGFKAGRWVPGVRNGDKIAAEAVDGLFLLEHASLDGDIIQALAAG